METVKIKFQGINHNTPDQEVADGWLEESINMRHDKGVFKPVGTKQRLYSTDPAVLALYSSIWFHEQDEVSNYIAFKPTTGELVWVNLGTSTETQVVKTYPVSADLKVLFIKRFMVVCHAAGMDKFLFQDGVYTLINITVPPQLMYKTSAAYPGTLQKTESVDADDGVAEILLGKYYKKLNDVNNDTGDMEGSIMLRCAYKLFDGSYIMASTPVYLKIANLNTFITINPGAPPDADITFYTNTIYAEFVKAYFNDLEDAKDIILSIVVFGCRNERLYGNLDSLTDANVFTLPLTPFGDILNISEPFKSMANSSSWYKLGEMNFTDVLDPLTGTTIELDTKGFYQDYATRETLPVDQFSYSEIWGNILMNYNDRVVMGNISSVFKNYFAAFANWGANAFDWVLGPTTEFAAYDPSNFTSSSYQAYLLYELKTTSGTKYILYDVGQQLVFQNIAEPSSYLLALPQVIGYPDARAIKMSVIIQKSGLYYKVVDVSLKKSESDNYAYAIVDNFDATKPTDVTYNYPPQEIGFEFDPADLVSLATYAQTILLDSNRVQVSELQNPYVFPAKNSYQVGVGTIRGFGVNSEPLSTGQFGEYPLIVGTSKGIWAMMQGQGDVIFSTISPVSGEVPDAFTSVGGGVVYTTPKGIFLIQGTKVTDLSASVTGSPNLYLQANLNYLHYISETNLVQLSNFMTIVDILDYIVYPDPAAPNVKLGFDKINNELIVTSATKGPYLYSYCYNFNTGLWHTINQSFRVLINAYPSLLGTRETGSETGIINISDEHYDGYSDILVCTRPLKFNAGDNFKVLMRCILRGRFSVATGTHAGFYIFGSSDLINWQRLIGCNSYPADWKTDILLTRVGSKFKYYIAVFAGQLDQKSVISGIDATINLKMNKKLR